MMNSNSTGSTKHKHILNNGKKSRFKHIKSIDDLVESGLIKALVVDITCNGKSEIKEIKKAATKKCHINCLQESKGESKGAYQQIENQSTTKCTLWQCGKCDKKFKQQYTLVRHLPVHTNERPFKCDMCEKSFRQASTLSRHKVVHTGTRPFTCSICNKNFNRSSTLIAHHKTHSDDKKYKCPYCSKAFHQKGNLRNHIFTHTGEKPYKCDLCNKGFNQMSNVICHKSHAHIERAKLECSICGKTFPSSYELHCHEDYSHENIKGHSIVTKRNKYTKIHKEKKIRENKINSSRDSAIFSKEDKTLLHNCSDLEDNNHVHDFLNFDSSTKNNIVSSDTSVLEMLKSNDSSLSSLSDTISLVDSITFKNHIREQLDIEEDVPPVAKLELPTELSKTKTNFFPSLDHLKSSKGMPLLVKVIKVANGKNILFPVTFDDLKLIDLSSIYLPHQDNNVVKTEGTKYSTVSLESGLDNKCKIICEQLETTKEESITDALELPNPSSETQILNCTPNSARLSISDIHNYARMTIAENFDIQLTDKQKDEEINNCLKNNAYFMRDSAFKNLDNFSESDPETLLTSLQTDKKNLVSNSLSNSEIQVPLDCLLKSEEKTEISNDCSPPLIVSVDSGVGENDLFLITDQVDALADCISGEYILIQEVY